MNANNFDVSMLLKMAHDRVRNYVIPGLTSSIVSTVRLFESGRDHQENITPHSHRFDFQCWVLAGEVVNRVWRCSHDVDGDWFEMSALIYGGEIGLYDRETVERRRMTYRDKAYSTGECYSMTSDEIHSIHFSRGAKVLLFEGPIKTNRSVILEPVVDGEAVPTFRVEPWMFKRDDKPKGESE